KLQPPLGKPQVEIPLEAPIAPVLVPLVRLLGMAEELDFHLLELTRTKRKVARRNFVAEALAELRHPEGNANAGAVEHVFEVDENTLCRLGAEEGGVLF